MTETNHAEQQAMCQLASIREMVAALECDYDRLEELREERDSYEPEDEERLESTENESLAAQWAFDNPEDAEELSALEGAAGDCKDRDDAQQRIDEDPLSVEVRSGWYTPLSDEESRKPAEYCILLCTGGPACRIIGRLGTHNDPESARLEYQDWGTPWTELIVTGDDDDALLAYASCFFFGE